MMETDLNFHNTGAITNEAWTNQHVVTRFATHKPHDIICKAMAFQELCISARDAAQYVSGTMRRYTPPYFVEHSF